MIKRLTSTATALLLACGVGVSSMAFAGAAATAEDAGVLRALTGSDDRAARAGNRRDFERFLERYEAANSAFLNGDASLWQAIATDREPASIFGGFGGLGEAGVVDVDHRYVLAATAFQPSGAVAEFEYLVKDVQGKLAYTVAIERADVLFTGQTQVQRQELRVTMMFRLERGEWKIIHRHADTMIELELPRP